MYNTIYIIWNIFSFQFGEDWHMIVKIDFQYVSILDIINVQLGWFCWLLAPRFLSIKLYYWKSSWDIKSVPFWLLEAPPKRALSTCYWETPGFYCRPLAIMFCCMRLCSYSLAVVPLLILGIIGEHVALLLRLLAWVRLCIICIWFAYYSMSSFDAFGNVGVFYVFCPKAAPGNPAWSLPLGSLLGSSVKALLLELRDILLAVLFISLYCWRIDASSGFFSASDCMPISYEWNCGLQSTWDSDMSPACSCLSVWLITVLPEFEPIFSEASCALFNKLGLPLALFCKY